MTPLAHWCLDQSKELVTYTLESAEELGIIKRCECCELLYKAEEVRNYGVARLCFECRENAEDWEAQVKDLNSWLDKERR